MMTYIPVKVGYLFSGIGKSGGLPLVTAGEKYFLSQKLQVKMTAITGALQIVRRVPSDFFEATYSYLCKINRDNWESTLNITLVFKVNNEFYVCFKLFDLSYNETDKHIITISSILKASSQITKYTFICLNFTTREETEKNSRL